MAVEFAMVLMGVVGAVGEDDVGRGNACLEGFKPSFDFSGLRGEMSVAEGRAIERG